ncbi:hypothetical protein GGX14DRAFT_696080 [Mycena pura]|uniref:Uncharacterized protein n=1 Tax=Mycena pura TaxID=153505 RepID=A0AAD6VLT4_9AGAR|nr:hypothetical protein GGX14DRAFT_696080 [Mycena pura]
MSEGQREIKSRGAQGLIPTTIVAVSQVFFARPPTFPTRFWGVRLLASASVIFPGIASRWSAAAFVWRLPSRSRLSCPLQALFKLGPGAAFVALLGFGAPRCGLRPRPANPSGQNFSLPHPLREVMFILYHVFHVFWTIPLSA